ncbi:MAG: hypothetical protein R3A47_00335 [Polyangiales bacterium]
MRRLAATPVWLTIRSEGDMGRTIFAVALVVAWLGSSSAQADTSVAVLGLQAPKGDDSVARELSARLRSNASRAGDWAVQPSDVSLEQMMLVTGCNKATVVCLSQIASSVNAERIVTGTVDRIGPKSNRQLRAKVYVFSARTGKIVHQGIVKFPEEKASSEYLETLARRYVAKFSGDKSVLNDPPASLKPEPTPVEKLDSEPTHELGAPVKEDEHKDKTFPLWPSIAAFGATGVFAGMTAWSWASLKKVQDDPNFLQARQNAGPSVGNVCTAGGSFGIENLGSLCDKADKHEKLQWVFVSLAAVSAGTGTFLLVKHIKDKGSEKRQLSIVPMSERRGGGVRALLQF